VGRYPACPHGPIWRYMNEKIIIAIERPCWGNGTVGTLRVAEKIDPLVLETSRDPGGIVTGVIGFLMNQLDREEDAIRRADLAAKERG
jgi:hypothetical protein